MAEFPALPFWTDAYLADTSHLTDVEHGRYILALIHLWRMPQLRFPNDTPWLARKFGRSVEVFEIEIKPIMREFLQCDGNWWTSKRLLLEWEYLKKQSYQRSVAAKSRWKKKKEACGKDAGPHAFRNAPTPTPTPTLKEETTTLSANADGVVATKKSRKGVAYPSEFEAFWSAYRPPPNAKKPDAAKAWSKIAEPRPSQPDLLRAVSNYRAWLAEETKKRRGSEFPMQHPATWLRGRVWENYLANGAAASGAVLALNSDEERQNLKRLGVV